MSDVTNDVPAAATGVSPASGVPAVDRYLAEGYEQVLGMSSRFAAGIAAGLMRIQSDLGIVGNAAEIGTFEGRFFIALAHALAEGEQAIGIDSFDWPNPQVIDRFEANCARHGLPLWNRVTIKANSRDLRPEELLAHSAGGTFRFFHIDGEHSRAALAKDLALATAVMADGGLIMLDDMLHPGYPTLVIAVEDHLAANPDWCVLAILDRESIVAAAKFVLCHKTWFKRFEEALLAAYPEFVWPLGADFEPHWCLVLSRDTRLADIVAPEAAST